LLITAVIFSLMPRSRSAALARVARGAVEADRSDSRSRVNRASEARWDLIGAPADGLIERAKRDENPRVATRYPSRR
jgi:hypothetical protein